MQGEGRPGGGNDVSSHRQDAVHVPDRLLEVATVDRVHGRDQEVSHGVAGEGSFVLREAVLEQLRHGGLRLGERREAVPDIPDRGDPQLLAKAAAGTAIVRHRHDGGDVRGVLLQAPQKRREAGSAPDRDDPWPAGQQPAPVHEVDERLLGALGERAEERADHAVRPVAEQEEPQGQQHRRPDPVLQELERQQRDRRLRRAGNLRVAVELANRQRTGKGEPRQAEERDAEPALDPDPRPEPATKVHAGLTLVRARGGRC